MRLNRLLLPFTNNSVFLRLSWLWGRPIRAVRSWRGRDEVDAMTIVQMNTKTAFSTVRHKADAFKNDVLEQLDIDKKPSFQILLDKMDNVFIQISENSVNYAEKRNLLIDLNSEWFQFWHEVKTFYEAVPIIKKIDYFTDYIAAYTYLFNSLTYINESESEDELGLLELKTTGLELLAQTVEVFKKILSHDILSQIYSETKIILDSIKSRSLEEYYKADIEESIVFTRLKAACTLIIVDLQSDTEYLATENQLQKNKSALELLDSWRKRRELSKENQLFNESDLVHDHMKEIVDSSRSPDQKVFST